MLISGKFEAFYSVDKLLESIQDSDVDQHRQPVSIPIVSGDQTCEFRGK